MLSMLLAMAAAPLPHAPPATGAPPMPDIPPGDGNALLAARIDFLLATDRPPAVEGTSVSDACFAYGSSLPQKRNHLLPEVPQNVSSRNDRDSSSRNRVDDGVEVVLCDLGGAARCCRSRGQIMEDVDSPELVRLDLRDVRVDHSGGGVTTGKRGDSGLSPESQRISRRERLVSLPADGPGVVVELLDVVRSRKAI